MQKLVLAAMLAVFAAAPAMAENSQQNKMKECNASAKDKKLEGDARKSFMSECLSAASTEGKKELTTQQEKMKNCNADAKKKALKADDRRKFMSECLSAK